MTFIRLKDSSSLGRELKQSWKHRIFLWSRKVLKIYKAWDDKSGTPMEKFSVVNTIQNQQGIQIIGEDTVIWNTVETVGNKNEDGIVTKEIKLELRITVIVCRTNVKFKKMQ